MSDDMMHYHLTELVRVENLIRDTKNFRSTRWEDDETKSAMISYLEERRWSLNAESKAYILDGGGYSRGLNYKVYKELGGFRC